MYDVNSAEKTVTLLKLLAQKPYQFGVTELGEKIGCGKSGTFKLLQALVNSGLATQTPDHKYTLGVAAYLLGKCYEDNIGLERFIRPYLTRLRDLTEETASFGMMVNGLPTTIFREESNHLIRIVGPVGVPRPINAGAIGKTLSAFDRPEHTRQRLMETQIQSFTDATITDPQKILEELSIIRTQGYAISDGEFTEETISIGAPIFDRNGCIWGVVSLTALRTRVSDIQKAQYIFLVKEVAQEISNALNDHTDID